jgi:hypothetical protein
MIFLVIRQKKIKTFFVLGLLLLLQTLVSVSDQESGLVPVPLYSGDESGQEETSGTLPLLRQRQSEGSQQEEIAAFNISISADRQLRRKQYCCCALSGVTILAGTVWYVAHRVVHHHSDSR